MPKWLQQIIWIVGVFLALSIAVYCAGCATVKAPANQAEIEQDCSKNVSNLIPKGWTIVEDVCPSKFETKDIKLVSFLKEGERFIGGKVMRQRSKMFGTDLGLRDGERILIQQNEIPAEERLKYYIVLSGTLLRHRDGRLVVPGIRWDGNKWQLHFVALDDHDDFDVGCRLPYLKFRK